MLQKYRSFDPVKKAYLRTSFIFAAAVIVTWAPTSAGQMYAFMNPRSTSYPFSVANAVVLPLQGFWNAIIYVYNAKKILSEELGRSWRNLKALVC